MLTFSQKQVKSYFWIPEQQIYAFFIHFIGYDIHIITHLRIDGLIIKGTSFFLGGQIFQAVQSLRQIWMPNSELLILPFKP